MIDKLQIPEPLVMTDTEILDFLSARYITVERSNGLWFVFWDKPKRGHATERDLRKAVCEAAAWVKRDEEQKVIDEEHPSLEKKLDENERNEER